jgi:hypothetical protein
MLEKPPNLEGQCHYVHTWRFSASRGLQDHCIHCKERTIILVKEKSTEMFSFCQSFFLPLFFSGECSEEGKVEV